MRVSNSLTLLEGLNMMDVMKHLQNLALVALAYALSLISVYAEPPCDDAALMATRGTWSKRPDSDMKGDPQFAARIDRIAELFKAAYPQPLGTEAAWYRSMNGAPLAPGAPPPYQYRSQYKAYYCNKALHKKMLGDETGNWAYAFVNDLNWFAEPVKGFQVQGQPVYLLTRRQGEFKGHPLYTGIHSVNSRPGSEDSRAILLTRPGQSPLIPVTKREFLEAFIADKDAEKRKILEQVQRMQGAAQQAMLKSAESVFATQVGPAKAALAGLSAADAQAPAVVEKAGPSFKQFGSEQAGGRAVMRLDPAYFNRSFKPDVPQFIVLYWRWERHVGGKYYKGEFEKNFDVRALAAMLDH